MKQILITVSPFKAKYLANSGWRHARLIEHRINTTLFKGVGHQFCRHQYPKALERVNPIEVHVIVFHHNINHTL